MNSKIKNKTLTVFNNESSFLQADSGDVELVELTSKLEVRLIFFEIAVTVE